MRLKLWVENHPGFLYAVMGLFYGMPGNGPATVSTTVGRMASWIEAGSAPAREDPQ
jgi:hypothetical protein